MKDKKLYLHVGFPKTGTSSIQRELSENPDVLAQADVRYLTSGRQVFLRKYDRHAGFRCAFASINEPVGIMKNRGIVFGPVQFFYKLILTISLALELWFSKQSNFIISDEDLMFYFEDEMFDRLLNFLGNQFQSIIVIVYVREPVSFIESSYSLHIKMGGHSTFQDFKSKILADTLFLNKLKIISQKNQLDDFIIVPLTGDSVKDFAKIVNLPLEIPITSTSTSLNKSLSRQGLEIFRRYNEQVSQDKRVAINGFRAFVSDKYMGKSSLVSAKEADEILDKFELEKREIIRQFGAKIYEPSRLTHFGVSDRSGKEQSEISNAEIDLNIDHIRRELKTR